MQNTYQGTGADIRPAHSVEAALEGGASRSPAISVAIALGVCACLLATSESQPLPNLTWTILFFFLAVEVEVRCLEIPFWMSLPTLCVGLLALGAVAGQPAFSHALGGALLAPTGPRYPGKWLCAVLWAMSPRPSLNCQ